MKFKLNKKKLKNLSKDVKALPADMTPQVGGGRFTGECTDLCSPSVGVGCAKTNLC